MAKARNSVELLAEDLARHLADGRRGEILREGFRVAGGAERRQVEPAQCPCPAGRGHCF